MAKLVGGLNIGLYGVVILVTLLAFHVSLRLLVVGCMCAALTVGMYAAPMAAMVRLINFPSWLKFDILQLILVLT